MSLLVMRNGLMDTIQDAGRYGHQHLGINPGGAMDLIAMQVANVLVGNEKNEAVLEMHFPAAEIKFEEPALIAISGADLAPAINGESISILQAVWIAKNTTLRFTKQVSGARAYIGIKGGFAIKKWMGSNSTNMKAAAGGFEGRALRKGDRIFFKQAQQDVFEAGNYDFIKLPWRADVADLYFTMPFHFIPGAEYEQLDSVSKQLLQQKPFLIEPQSDRMGYRLRGDALSLQEKKEMISTAVTKGTIQLLPDGQLIILMADHQTTGGYPRVGHIISADISSLAQLPAGQTISLTKTDPESAEQRLLLQQRNLQQLQNACIFRLQEYFHTS